jgi:hypothetical protein
MMANGKLTGISWVDLPSSSARNSADAKFWSESERRAADR